MSSKHSLRAAVKIGARIILSRETEARGRRVIYLCVPIPSYTVNPYTHSCQLVLSPAVTTATSSQDSSWRKGRLICNISKVLQRLHVAKTKILKEALCGGSLAATTVTLRQSSAWTKVCNRASTSSSRYDSEFLYNIYVLSEAKVMKSHHARIAHYDTGVIPVYFLF